MGKSLEHSENIKWMLFIR